MSTDSIPKVLTLENDSRDALGQYMHVSCFCTDQAPCWVHNDNKKPSFTLRYRVKAVKAKLEKMCSSMLIKDKYSAPLRVKKKREKRMVLDLCVLNCHLQFNRVIYLIKEVISSVTLSSCE